jgi:hypothetical protein
MTLHANSIFKNLSIIQRNVYIADTEGGKDFVRTKQFFLLIVLMYRKEFSSKYP